MASPDRISRRGVLAALGGGLALSGAGALSSDAVVPPLELDARQPAGEWPMAQRDPQRTGYQPQPGPRNGLRERWHSGTGPVNLVRPGLVATGGRVLTAGRYATRAFAASDGSLDWERRQRDQFQSGFSDGSAFEFVQAGPTVSGDRVYTVSGVTLHEQRIDDGESGWAFRTNSSFHRVLPVGNAIFAGVSFDTDEQLVALDQSTGLRRWTQVTDDVPLAYDPDSELLVTGVGGGGSRGTLLAREPTDGSVVWRTAVATYSLDSWNGPAVSQGRVYAGGSPVTAINAADGSVTWTTRLESMSDPVSPVTDGDHVYVVGQGTAVALDAATGERRWTAPVDETSRFVPPILAGETLYLATGPDVFAIDVTDGSERFRQTVSENGDGIDGLVSADGDLYVRVGQSLRAFAESEAGDT